MPFIPRKYSIVYLVIGVLALLGAAELFWTAYTTKTIRPALIAIGAVFAALLLIGEWRSSARPPE
jgi:membrane associated rhomboid family serine protease